MDDYGALERDMRRIEKRAILAIAIGIGAMGATLPLAGSAASAAKSLSILKPVSALTGDQTQVTTLTQQVNGDQWILDVAQTETEQMAAQQQSGTATSASQQSEIQSLTQQIQTVQASLTSSESLTAQIDKTLSSLIGDLTQSQQLQQSLATLTSDQAQAQSLAQLLQQALTQLSQGQPLAAATLPIAPQVAPVGPPTTTTTQPAPAPAPTQAAQPGPPATGHYGDYAYQRGVNIPTLEQENNKHTADSKMGEPESSYQYLANKGMKIVRLEIPWTLLQPVPSDGNIQTGLNTAVNKANLAVVKKQVTEIGQAGMRAVLDLHNGCDYPRGDNKSQSGEVYCGNGISTAQATRVWKAISAEFKSDHSVYAYDLFNETPSTKVDFTVYKQYIQDVVNAIRAGGDTHTIWVQPLSGTNNSAETSQDSPTGPWITDPLHDIVYSQHMYPDGTGNSNAEYQSSSSTQTADTQTFLQKENEFGAWCEKWQVHCSIGEIGWPAASYQSQWPGSASQWNTLGNEFYTLADKYRFDVTYYAGGSEYPNYLYAFQGSKKGIPATGITESNSQAPIIEAHPSA
jgi:endoglucanase